MINSYNDHKRYLILNLINHLRNVSRTDLADLTGYQLASISTLTKQLIEENILKETGSYSAGQGRKRTLLTLNSQYLCAISISFFGTEVSCITAQFDGKILSKQTLDFSTDASRSGLCDRVCTLIRHALAEFSDRHIIGIGLCTPINDPANFPIVSMNPDFRQLRDWIQKALLPFLQEEFSLPIALFHDNALPALVEKSFGAAQDVSDFICVELSNGIGCSICANGKPVIGSGAYAGELGHTVIDKSQISRGICYCGKPGCIEHYAGLPALLEQISKESAGRTYTLLSQNDLPLSLTADDLAKSAKNGDLLSRHYLRQAAEDLGLAVSNAVMLLNPERIILFGHMLSLGEYFIERLKDAILDNVSPKSAIKREQIVISQLLPEQLPLGAISELFASYLKKEDFNWVYRLPQNFTEK